MRRAIFLLLLAPLLSNCMTAPRMPAVFAVFFVPGTTDLTTDAQEIVREAARSATEQRASKIDVAVPVDAPGVSLTEGRFTAIQNVLSASGIDSGLLQRGSLSATAAMLPGAADRAEIRLVGTRAN